MTNIQAAIEQAARRFATEVVNILRGATLSELQALAGRPRGPDSTQADRGAVRRRARAAEGSEGAAAGERGAARRPRRAGKKRSPAEVARLGERVLDFLRSARQDLGVSVIADGLQVKTADLGLPLTRLRQAGKLAVQGTKRSTVYRVV